MLKLKQLTSEKEKGRHGDKVGNVGRQRDEQSNNGGMIIYEMNKEMNLPFSKRMV
jgi:hypothetical protein